MAFRRPHMLVAGQGDALAAKVRAATAAVSAASIAKISGPRAYATHLPAEVRKVRGCCRRCAINANEGRGDGISRHLRRIGNADEPTFSHAKRAVQSRRHCQCFKGRLRPIYRRLHGVELFHQSFEDWRSLIYNAEYGSNFSGLDHATIPSLFMVFVLMMARATLAAPNRIRVPQAFRMLPPKPARRRRREFQRRSTASRA
jgi:hypothetical protein